MSLRFETDPMLRALELMCGSGLTRQLVDRKKAVAIIRAGRASGQGSDAIRLVRDARANWLTWETVTQRRWQRETRRPSRARQHDSISIREKYVRCGAVQR